MVSLNAARRALGPNMPTADIYLDVLSERLVWNANFARHFSELLAYIFL
jgi:hypothetical protein